MLTQLLPWKDESIPHVLEVSEMHSEVKDAATVYLTVKKDGGTQKLEVDVLDASPETIAKTLWTGRYLPVSEESSDGHVYSQVRVLLQTEEGCVIWIVVHYKGPDGKDYPADSLVWLPSMAVDQGKLVPMHG